MGQYFIDIFKGIKAFMGGMSLTLKHMNQKKKYVATMQYPAEKWPIPDRDIGFNHDEYNVIRSRLHVDIDDCIGCLQCERACPVDCIKIDTVKPPRGNDFDCGITSNDTQKKMIVPRFTIDMSECMFCNLCVYPCPEECIYMVGGPNEDKHEMDYEYSKYERDGLIFEFATSTDQEILDAGGEDYLQQRKDKKKNLDNGKKLKGKIVEPVPIDDKKKSKESKVKKASSGPDIKLLNIIEDKMTRAIAKKAFLGVAKTAKGPDEIILAISEELKKSDKLNDDAISKLDEIKKGLSVESASKAPSESSFSIKSFNGLSDKMARGLCKKIFLSGTKSGKEISLIANDISDELKGKDLMSDEIVSILKEMTSSQDSSKKSEEALFHIKELNIIEDKMARGLAKKVYVLGKKQGKSSTDVIDNIIDELSSKDKIDDSLSKILKGLVRD